MNSRFIERLLAVDTPTVCNAIEMVQGKRGFDRLFRKTPVWTGRIDQRIFGQACTARISSAREPVESIDRLKARRLAYFDYMAAGEQPRIAVIQDIDEDEAIGAWWGEINALAHHRVCQLSGALTNGLVRDLGDLPEQFPIGLVLWGQVMDLFKSSILVSQWSCLAYQSRL